jgi:hypothetical protein
MAARQGYRGPRTADDNALPVSVVASEGKDEFYQKCGFQGASRLGKQGSRQHWTGSRESAEDTLYWRLFGAVDAMRHLRCETASVKIGRDGLRSLGGSAADRGSEGIEVILRGSKFG